MVRYVCTNCGRLLQIVKAAKGNTAQCPACGHVTVVPGSRRERRAQIRAWSEFEGMKKMQARRHRRAQARARREAEEAARTRALVLAEEQRQSELRRQAHYELAQRGAIFDADILVETFRQDWVQVQKDTGLTPLQISEGVKAASPAIGLGAGYATGNVWVGIIAAVGAALLSGPLAQGYARLKFQEWRQKWLQIFSHCSEEQLTTFAGSLQTRHPLVFQSLVGLGRPALRGG